MLLTGCGDTVVGVTTVQKGEEPPAASTGAIPAAAMKGQAQSPDGKYEVRLEGHSEGVTSAGLPPSEYVHIVDIKTGEVKWEADGGYTVTAQWSSDGKFVAISRAGRTWEEIVVIETEDFATYHVTLPDGSAFGEYTFVEEMAWESTNEYEHRLLFTLKKGEDLSDYGFQPTLWYGELGGDTCCRDSEVLSDEYDFSQDGTAEEVSLVTVMDPDGQSVSWYELRVEQDGETLLREEFATAHAGYNSILACKKDGKDYIFRYRPGFGMGHGCYDFQLLKLGETVQTVQQNSVEFDANFHHPDYSGPFDAAAIADFLKESYELMEQSTLLFSTEGGEVRGDMSGVEFFPLIDTYFDLPADSALWEQYLREFAGEITALTSPDGRYQARAVQNLNSCCIYVTNLSTEETTCVKLPDDSSIPAGATVDEMRWLPGGDIMNSPSLWFLLEKDGLTTDYRFYTGTGQTYLQTTTILDGEYDFDHDGVKEVVEVDGTYVEYADKTSQFEVRLLEQGEYIWMEDAHTSHVGWNTILACRVDGQDYLLRYNPYMSTGLASYTYQLFYLDGNGEAVNVAQNEVEFNENFGSPVHQYFDTAAIAAFLRDIYSLLEQSTLLISTEDGEGWESVSGTEFFWEQDIFDLPEDTSLWEQHLRDYEARLTAARTQQ